MRLRTRLLASCFGALLFAVIAFLVVTAVGYRYGQHMADQELTQAVAIYEQNGPQALSRHLASLDALFGSEHHLMDSKCVDLISGEDRSSIVAKLSSPSTSGTIDTPLNRYVLGKRTLVSENGQYWFLAIQQRIDRPRQFVYMVTLLATIGVLYSFIAAGITSPLRTLATAAQEFGRGNMAVRVPYRRNDEIGDLARSFNAMADRVTSLLVAERQLLQDVSHELRSPLARIAFAAELARSAEDRDEALDRLDDELGHLTALVVSLLDVVTVDGDPVASKMEEIEAKGLIDDVVKSCTLQAEAQHCRIRVLGSAPGVVRCNAELLRRAFDNVIRNAVQYSPRDGDIEVSLQSINGWALVSVRDYGPGVPTELLPRIFEPFFRVDEARDSATGGVGLGLSIVKRIVLLHHGKATADNSSPGLRVNIAIPLVSQPEGEEPHQRV